MLLLNAERAGADLSILRMLQAGGPFPRPPSPAAGVAAGHRVNQHPATE